MHTQVTNPAVRVALSTAAAVLLLASASAAQDSSPWWPSGAQADPAPAEGGSAPAEQPKEGWLVQSPLANIGWPEIKMPRVDWKPGWGGGEGAAGPLAKMKSMTRSAAQKTRTAWNTTVDRLKFNRKSEPAATSEPGFFARLFGPEEQNPGPQTVPEFLAQKRPGASNR